TVRDSATRTKSCRRRVLGEKMGIPEITLTPGHTPGEGIPMGPILPLLRYAVKQRLLRQLRRCRHAALRSRYLIIVNLFSHRPPDQTAAALHIDRSTVYRVARRFREGGALGLLDRREDNGTPKLQENYLGHLDEVVRSHPQEHGWRRPTWTRAMLVETV